METMEEEEVQEPPRVPEVPKAGDNITKYLSLVVGVVVIIAVLYVLFFVPLIETKEPHDYEVVSSHYEVDDYSCGFLGLDVCHDYKVEVVVRNNDKERGQFAVVVSDYIQGEQSESRYIEPGETASFWFVWEDVGAWTIDGYTFEVNVPKKTVKKTIVESLL